VSKVKQIRPSLGFTKLSDADLLARANAVHAGMARNPAYPNSPVDLATFKAAINNYAAAITAALDGSKKAIADREKQRDQLIAMLRQLGHYVEAACNDDMTVLLSSGFEAASWTRTPPQPLAQPSIVRVDQGNTGQLLVNIKTVPRARSYELRYAALENGGTPGAWTTTILVAAKQAAPIHNLTPGTIYSFQVRAINKLGYTDWSVPVSRMCI
jgi:hypothetical protein